LEQPKYSRHYNVTFRGDYKGHTRTISFCGYQFESPRKCLLFVAVRGVARETFISCSDFNVEKGSSLGL
ncbi:hypothetical protein SGI37_20205, partial [Providencia rettgeri]